MRYTLAMAIKELKGDQLVYAPGGATDQDLIDKINRAIRALAQMRGWKCLRRVLRFSSAGPYFTLPQGCAGLVRVCVNGRPTTVRGQDFRFVHSGPGDVLSGRRIKLPPGFSEVSNVFEDGVTPLMNEPFGPFRIFAYRADKGKHASMVITGVDCEGRTRRVELSDSAVYDFPEYDDSGTLISGTEVKDAVPKDVIFTRIDSVVIDDETDTDTILYYEDVKYLARCPAALYRSEIKVPTFKRYFLPDVRHCQPVELLVEARADPIPLSKLDDVLPFETIEPIQWMIRSDWEMRSGEVSKGESYRNNAANWLLAQEVTDDTVQTSFVINSPFVGSPGELSREAENI